MSNDDKFSAVRIQSSKMVDLAEYARPWKLFTLALGIVLLILGSFYYQAPDWDIPISLIMAIFAYLAAPWSLRVIMERRWHLWPAMLFATWFTVDGCYWIYWHFKNPIALELMREANFLASLSLYGMCGVVWLYRGSLAELTSDIGAIFKRQRARSSKLVPMNVRLIRTTVLAAGITTLLLAQRHAGFMLLLLAVPLVPWFLYSAFVITTQPTRRVVQSLKVTIWLMSVLTIVCIHYYYRVSTRHDAQDVANAIQKYSTEHGVCPSSLEAIGMSNAQLKSKLGYSAYVCEAGHPTLFYVSTHAPFEQDRYDFVRKEWIHVLD